MTRFIAKSLLERLEREWRVIDPERQKLTNNLPQGEVTVSIRRLRMGRFDEIDIARE